MTKSELKTLFLTKKAAHAEAIRFSTLEHTDFEGSIAYAKAFQAYRVANNAYEAAMAQFLAQEGGGCDE